MLYNTSYFSVLIFISLGRMQLQEAKLNLDDTCSEDLSRNKPSAKSQSHLVSISVFPTEIVYGME